MLRIDWPLFLQWFRRAGLHAPAGLRAVVVATLIATLVVAALLAPARVHAQDVNLTTFELTRGEEGLQLTFSARFELPRPVEDALQKGVPLVFVAEAVVFRDRWYWRDKEVASATRSWRLAYQPLTRKYRVTFGSLLNQSFDNVPDALAALSSSVNWKIADAAQLDGDGHYVEFKYELDTTQMPRPMQIGIGGQADWTLHVDRVRRLN